MVFSVDSLLVARKSKYFSVDMIVSIDFYTVKVSVCRLSPVDPEYILFS